METCQGRCEIDVLTETARREASAARTDEWIVVGVLAGWLAVIGLVTGALAGVL